MNTSTSNFLKGVIMKMTCAICGKEIYNSYISCLPVKKGMCCSCCDVKFIKLIKLKFSKIDNWEIVKQYS